MRFLLTIFLVLCFIHTSCGNVLTAELNAANEIESRAYPSGQSVTYARDGAGRLTGTSAADNQTTRAYDVMDRVTRAENGAAILGWDYHGPSGMLTSTTQQNLAQPGQPVYTTRRLYDATHTRLEQLIYPSGSLVNYYYDDAARLTTLEHNGFGVYQFTYDTRGLPESMTDPNGAFTT